MNSAMAYRFNWQAGLAKAYSAYPEADVRPVIGITGNYGDQNCKLAEGYYKSVLRAGGTPVIIPPLSDTDAIINTLEHIDGLLLSGGADYNPLYVGQEPSPRLGGINSERDLPELLITQLAYNRQIPILGICRGIQTLAIALGGSVAQDISEVCGSKPGVKAVKHSQDADRSEPTHSITVDAAAHAQDGVIEAIESREFKSIIGVQWHPECLSAEESLPVFSWLVRQAAHYREACSLHQRILTLDTHCDTPMFFPQGVDFGMRDDRILVDLHKMSEGRQDATIMVAYLPQPKIGETFSSKVAFDVSNPMEYANLIFDKIEELVSKNSRYLSIARTPADLYVDKRQGRRSIMMGIENGLALNGQLQNLHHFAQRGIVYMTLCHNGDNDICDSARGCNTHHGLSQFGRQVVREMNRLGIMVDMSHAAEKSFYDALEVSQQPIVCSHSSCRALCDHPRNLTDEQMRALAAKGGVMQVTMYNGFLVKDGEATVLDALRHLEHAVEVMGIDHVGIGTDFDGDGGIRGVRFKELENNETSRNFYSVRMLNGIV